MSDQTQELGEVVHIVITSFSLWSQLAKGPFNFTEVPTEFKTTELAHHGRTGSLRDFSTRVDGRKLMTGLGSF